MTGIISLTQLNLATLHWISQSRRRLMLSTSSSPGEIRPPRLLAASLDRTVFGRVAPVAGRAMLFSGWQPRTGHPSESSQIRR